MSTVASLGGGCDVYCPELERLAFRPMAPVVNSYREKAGADKMSDLQKGRGVVCGALWAVLLTPVQVGGPGQVVRGRTRR